MSSRFPGVQKPIDQYGPQSGSTGATGGGDDDEEDDDFDPFASDDEVGSLMFIKELLITMGKRS